jgi:hypothetical protein
MPDNFIRFKVFMAVIQVMVVFWGFKLCGGQLSHPEYGGSTFLRYVVNKQNSLHGLKAPRDHYNPVMLSNRRDCYDHDDIWRLDPDTSNDTSAICW